ncbi:MAG: aldo/keto reductase [Candidatus Latescibacteria bacterium]|nr:aldo/keto reductase [Candidatus Latescibacterota bacterium]
MEYTILGRTGLSVSRMGVGAGGPSQIGRKTGLDEEQSAALLRRAFERGVNFVDTAEGYGTEPIVGRALKGVDRSSVIVSSKKSTRRQEVTPQTVRASLEQSLRNLGTDYIDLYNLHGVVPQDYRRLAEEIYPVLVQLHQEGKIRFVGLSEMFNEDLDHLMLQQALDDNIWDVLMVGFNILNQTARHTVLQRARAQDVGIQVMFAVRRALAHPDQLGQFVAALVERGQVDPADLGGESLADSLLAEAASLPDAAYRFCRDEPGVHIVLSGTGNADHLQANLASFQGPPLSARLRSRLEHIFRKVDSTTGQSV